MLRLITGSILLLGSAALFSYEKIRMEKVQYTHLKEWLHFLHYIENNIRSFRTPLPEIYTSYSRQENDLFARRLTAVGPAVLLSETTLPDGAAILLQEYIRKAGNNYESEEIRLCQFTIEALQEIMNTTQKDLYEKTRLYRTLPLMLALSIVLLFL